MKNNKQTLHNVQMLRAIAAILVVFHHAFPHYQAMGETSQLIEFISKWGFAGVDIFFVISGFIMAYTTFSKERTFNNAKRFFKHRFFRIYLGYWPFFIAALLIEALLVRPNKLSTLDIIGSFFLTNADMFQLVLSVSWSLSYEIYFYFLFLFTFFFPIKQLYFLIPILFISLVAIVFYTHFNPQMVDNFFYSSLLLEFFAGVLLYMYQKYLMKLWILPISLLIVIIAYGYGITYENKNGLLRVMTFGVGALFVILIALILETKNLYRAGKRFVLLGDASYTLYLSHLIIINLFYFTGLRKIFTQDGTFIPLLGFIFILLICIFFSITYYQKIEQKVYRKAIADN